MANQLQISRFDLGVTDAYLDAPNNACEELDNFLLKNTGKLETRPGTVIYDAITYQTPAGAQRIGSLPKLENDVVFFQSAKRFHYNNSGAWAELTGPGGSSFTALAAGTTSSYVSWAEWQGHLIITSDAFGSPMKIYRDGSDVLQVRNAGLPKVTLTAMIAMANDLKSKFNAHIADVTEHTAGADSTNVVSSADAYDFPTLVTLVTELITDYDAHEGDAELSSAWLYHASQEATDHSLTSTTAPVTLSDVKTALDNFKASYNAHDADGTAHGTDTLHASSKYSEPQLASAGGSGSSYSYYFCAKFTYTVGDATYIDRGPTHFKTISNVGTPNTNTITISQIPIISNGTTENYATSVITWEIYRTTDAGVIPYFVKEVTNGTTSTTDTAADTTIDDNITLYTNGGVLDNDPPPPAKFVVVVNDIAWYAHVKEGAQIRKSRIRQSAKFDPDSCPTGSYIDLEDEIVGMGAVNIYPIALCKNHVYRIEGNKDDSGRGVISKREIARGIGGINHLSIVNTSKGVFFASSTGFYFTDGFQVQKISPHLDETYQTLTNTATKRARVYGSYDAKNERIRWAMQSSSSSTDNDTIYVLDLNFFNPGQDGVFTTETPASGSWSPCAIGYDEDDVFVIADKQGYIFKSDENAFTDPKIDTSLTPSSWQTSAVVWDFRGAGFNMGDANTRKISTYLTVVAENVTPLSLRPKRKNDDSGYFKNLEEVRTRDNIVWKDPFGPAWKPTPDGYPWRTFPLVIERRRFPAGNQRALYVQIQFTNSNTIIYRSDDYGTGTVAVSGTSGTVTLSGSLDWPSDIVDYYLAFESDSYTREYLITARSATVATFVDTTGAASTGAGKKWVIRGTRKRERFNLVSYTIEFEMASASHAHYRGEDGGNDA